MEGSSMIYTNVPRFEYNKQGFALFARTVGTHLKRCQLAGLILIQTDRVTCHVNSLAISPPEKAAIAPCWLCLRWKESY